MIERWQYEKANMERVKEWNCQVKKPCLKLCKNPPILAPISHYVLVYVMLCSDGWRCSTLSLISR
jgi:hypothetical protein